MRNIINFNSADIPFDCRVRNINIICLSSGETTHQMKLLNRDHFYSSRCLKCSLKLNEWQDQSVDGISYTNKGYFDRIQSELEITVEESAYLISDEVELQKIQELDNNLLAEAQYATHVEAGQSLILPAIELSTNFTIMICRYGTIQGISFRLLCISTVARADGTTH